MEKQKLNQFKINNYDVLSIIGLSEKTPIKLYEELKNGNIKNNNSKYELLKKYVSEISSTELNLKYKELNKKIDIDFKSCVIDAIGYDSDNKKSLFIFGINENKYELPTKYKALAIWCKGMSDLSNLNIENTYVIIYDCFFNLNLFKIDYDINLFNEINDKINIFYNNVINGISPELTLDDKIELYSKINNLKMIKNTNIDDSLIDKYLDLKSKKSEIEKEIENIENTIKAEIEDCEGIMDDNFIITWKSQKRIDLDKDKIKLECPDILEKYKRETIFRVLRIKKINASKE